MAKRKPPKAAPKKAATKPTPIDPPPYRWRQISPPSPQKLQPDYSEVSRHLTDAVASLTKAIQAANPRATVTATTWHCEVT